MEHAKTLFEQKGATPCSQVVLITDGQPTGPQGRVDDVRNQFVPWFKSQGIPVNAFGLKLDTNTEDGHNADVLLRDITNTTNGKYTPAVNATDLASSVIGLYSAWKGLSFTPITLNQQNGNYAIPIDDNVTQATIITFHSTNVSVGQLQRTDGATIQLFQTTDRHYQMDNLISPIPSGTYTITVGSDPDASVYALIDSPIKAEFTDSATSAYTGQTFTIRAHFINQQNGGGVVITGATKVTATVTEVVNGQSVKTNVVLNRLSPNSDIFTADYAVHPTTIKLLDQPQKVGTLTLDLTATEGNLTRSATKTVPLYVPQKPPPPPCHEGFWPCFQKQNQTAIAISIAAATPLLLILIVTLILWLIWRQQPAPFGILHTPSVPQKLGFGNYEEDTSDIAVTLAKVGAARSLQKRIFQRSVLTSYEIEHHRDAKGGFDFDPASFQLVFKRGKKMDIHLISGGPIVLRNGNEKFELESGETHDLESGSSIIITNTERATFS